MSVGLLDCDWYNGYKDQFNLEIMKLSSYYKKKNQIVSLSPGFHPDSYTKFIMRQDKESDNYFTHLTDYKNLEYGGLYYNNGLYIPLDEEIELCVPDTSIYEKVAQPTNRNEEALYKKLLTGAHVRISLDERNIWDKCYKTYFRQPQSQTISIYDRNITQVKDYQLALKELYRISNYQKTQFNFINPIEVSSPNEIYELLDITRVSNTTYFYLNTLLEDEELVELVEKVSKKTLSRIFYTVALPYNISNQNFLDILTKIFYQVIFLRNHRRYFPLIVGDNFPFPDEWQNVFDCWNSYTYIGSAHFDNLKYKDGYLTLYGFFKSNYKNNVPNRRTIERDDAAAAFEFVYDNHIELFRDFYEISSVELKGGKFVCSKRITN